MSALRNWGVFISAQPGILRVSKTRIFVSFCECLQYTAEQRSLYFWWVSTSASIRILLYFGESLIPGSFDLSIGVLSAARSRDLFYFWWVSISIRRDLAVLPVSVENLDYFIFLWVSAPTSRDLFYYWWVSTVYIYQKGSCYSSGECLKPGSFYLPVGVSALTSRDLLYLWWVSILYLSAAILWSSCECLKPGSCDLSVSVCTAKQRSLLLPGECLLSVYQSGSCCSSGDLSVIFCTGTSWNLLYFW